MGVVTFLPAAFFFGWFVIVAILWLGLAGHAVPAVMAERLGVLGALRRTFQLGRADYVHAAGSFAVLAILFGLSAKRPRVPAPQPGGRDGADSDLPRGPGGSRRSSSSARQSSTSTSWRAWG